MKLILKRFTTINLALLLLLTASYSYGQKAHYILNANTLNKDVAAFNAADTEAVKNYVPNAASAQWLAQNIPLFNCPDSVLQLMYNYRWWSFRKHLVQTPDGFVFTEFIIPVKFAGVYNTISSAVGHQVNESRWLYNQQYVKDYISFWLFTAPKQVKPHGHNFSSWIDDAVYQAFLVNRDTAFIAKVLPALVADYKQWEAEKQLPNGMFWQFDVRDAMEESISGSRKLKNVRPTINSYMYGNAVAIARMAALLHNDTLRNSYQAKADKLKQQVEQTLWDDKASFFKVQFPDGKLSDAREAIGFIPWYFNLPADKPQYAKAWDQLVDTAGFNAPWGLTTAERRHPKFRTHGTGKCEWDGAIWPYATTQDLKALANLLSNYKNRGSMSASVFYNALHQYAASQQMYGRPYIGEYQDEKNGKWLKGDNPRSAFYNHSSYADLIINDLIGLKPRLDNQLEINPLVPQNKWDWFCLDGVPYHNHYISILWDKTGQHYQKGKGLQIFADGKKIYQGSSLNYQHE